MKLRIVNPFLTIAITSVTGRNGHRAEIELKFPTDWYVASSYFCLRIQLLFLYPDSRWLRIANTKTVSSGATYLYNAT